MITHLDRYIRGCFFFYLTYFQSYIFAFVDICQIRNHFFPVLESISFRDIDDSYLWFEILMIAISLNKTVTVPIQSHSMYLQLGMT